MATKKKTKEYKQEIIKPLVVGEPDAVYLNLSKRYSYADYLTWTDDVRRELIDGIVYVLSAPTRLHMDITGFIWEKFRSFIKKKEGECKVYFAPFDVRFPNNGETDNNKIYTVVQPDICVICDPEKLDRRGCIGAPDLIVEVQSPSTAKKDMFEKFKLYERSGVKEYWIVFPKEEGLTVFKLGKNGKYDQGTAYQFEGKVPVGIFKGLKIDLEELFQDI